MALSNAKWKRGGQKHVSARKPKIELFKGKDKKHYFRLVAANGEIVSTSEGYTRRFTANQGAKRAVQMAVLLQRTTGLLNAAVDAKTPKQKANVRRRAKRLKAAVTRPRRKVQRA